MYMTNTYLELQDKQVNEHQAVNKRAHEVEGKYEAFIQDSHKLYERKSDGVKKGINLRKSDQYENEKYILKLLP